jgi:hypothetical protein
MYVSLLHGELEAGIRDTCRRHGWPVLAPSDQPAERRLQALRLADACIVDVSAASPDVGAELAFALCQGRPVITLRNEMASTAPFVEDIVRDHPAVRHLSYDDVKDCLTALDQVLGDLIWQEQVARAAPSG